MPDAYYISDGWSWNGLSGVADIQETLYIALRVRCNKYLKRR